MSDSPPLGKDGLPTPILVSYELVGKELHITNKHLPDAPPSVYHAAPDLFFALGRLFEVCDTIPTAGKAFAGPLGNAQAVARAALLKARGESKL